ncbi:cancer/testis antigen family 47 member C1 [Balaenoptera ricei]|uniref:cancer/testis antigen family 47 member C1 n=1 Tax=Balaenoptera ricei TaxID=2746895 RepID=UPI0028BE04D7|nr:cancer/testis antigen family 47 member C1 [Balaenoptera ricei]
MSATGDEDPAPGGPEGPAGADGAQAEAARAGDRGHRDSEPRGGDAAPGARGGSGEAALEGGGAEEESDIGPAEEEEEEEAGGLDLVEVNQFPVRGFYFILLGLVYSLLRRVHCNDHVLVPPPPRPRHGLAWLPQLRAPDGQGQGPAAQEPEEAEEAAAPEPEEAEEAIAPEGERLAGGSVGRPGIPRDPGSEGDLGRSEMIGAIYEATGEGTTKYPDENTNEEAQGAESEGEREKFNKKQEPEKDLNPAGQTQKVQRQEPSPWEQEVCPC